MILFTMLRVLLSTNTTYCISIWFILILNESILNEYLDILLLSEVYINHIWVYYCFTSLTFVFTNCFLYILYYEFSYWCFIQIDILDNLVILYWSGWLVIIQRKESLFLEYGILILITFLCILFTRIRTMYDWERWEFM